MATAEKIEEAFDDLGFEIEDAKVKDKLVGLCLVHRVDEDKISCEYLAYLSRKKLPITMAPTNEILEDFDLDLAKHLQTLTEHKKHITDTVGGKFIGDNDGMEVNDEEEDGAMSFYGTPARKPATKRQLTPDDIQANKKRFSGNDEVLPFSPTSFRHSPSLSEGVGKKYSSRTNAGKVMIKFGSEEMLSSKAWINSTPYEVTIKTETAKHPRDYRYMFERLRDKAGHLDENICHIGDLLSASNALDPHDMCMVMPETFDVVGRICCDSEGRLNAKSIVLQGSQDVCRGRTLPLDPSMVTNYSLFPGQIVGVKATNPTGNRLIASSLMFDGSPKLTPVQKIKLNDASSHMQVVVSSGPYTTTDNLNYEPLNDLLQYVAKHQPHVLILCGPFVDAKHPKVESGDIGDVTFDGLFAHVMKKVAEVLQDIDTQVLIVPSSRDVHHSFIYPTPAFPDAKSSNQIRMMTDPCTVSIEGVTFGITSTDILFHLGKEEISFPPRSGDRLRRLATHLIQQRSFYPLYPPSEDVNLDSEQLEAIAQFDQQPHVMILPSDLLHFFKDINGGLVMNPQRLSRGEGGGVFARLKIQGGSDEDNPFAKRVSAEIVRI